ncbi:MAG: rRNA pseudouridine synthase [Firmicutes bacterium]|nr:rRNA pseudouridine synthase [Bacillota bacterium]
MERLQKVIANSGYCSRRKAEELILQNKVSVNGQIVNELGTKVNGTDTIEINGQMLNTNHDKVYYLLNKPRGVISSVSDEKGRKTVVDLIETDKRIYPVGRLDYDTTGLLILTNDGDLANKLMHPSNKIPKTYLAKLAGIIDKDAIEKLKKGVVVEGRKVKIVDFKIKKKDLKKEVTYISITIIEGRNHIVKNLFKELGYLVDKLTRTNYDFLELGTLASGEYRELSVKEVKKLYSK